MIAPRSRLSALCAELTELSPAELEQVRLRVQFLTGRTDDRSAQASPDTRARSSDRDWMLRAIEDELRRRGHLGSGRVLATKIRPDWDGVSSGLRSDLLRAVGQSGERQSAALGRLAAHALAEWLVRVRIPLSPRTMVQNIEKTFTALDALYPGYIGTGMLRYCVEGSQPSDTRRKPSM